MSSYRSLRPIAESYIRWRQLPSRDSTTPRSPALAVGKRTHLDQNLPTGLQGNTRPGNMLSERDVHSSDTATWTGAAADQSAANKIAKYDELVRTHVLYPDAIETGGTWNHWAV